MVRYALRHWEELHNIILEDIIEWNKTAERSQKYYIGQIICDARIKTFKELKENASNRTE